MFWGVGGEIGQSLTAIETPVSQFPASDYSPIVKNGDDLTLAK